MTTALITIARTIVSKSELFLMDEPLSKEIENYAFVFLRY